MARKNQTIIHPLAATEALNGYHTDVGYLLMVVQSAITFLRSADTDPDKLRKLMPDQLEEAQKRVSRWYEIQDRV